MKIQTVYCYPISDIQKALYGIPEEFRNECLVFDLYYGYMIFKCRLPDELLESFGLVEDKPYDL